MLQNVTENKKIMNYPYEFEKYIDLRSKHICPNCNCKTFVFYIDAVTKQCIDTTVGKCDRAIKCAYNFTPYEYFHDNNISGKIQQSIKPGKVITKKKSPSFISFEILLASIQKYEQNNFVAFLLTLFGKEITTGLIEKYFIGTSKHWPGSTVFWQIDSNGKVRTGKIMLYDANTGNRIKEPINHITWVHKLIKQSDYNMTQCLFGEHLLTDKTKPVAIVESEKTAIIASVYLPQFIWLATGGLSNLTAEKCKVLKDFTVFLFPDVNGFEKWKNRMKELSQLMRGTIFKISDLIEKNATDKEREHGCDLADYLTKLDWKSFHSA